MYTPLGRVNTNGVANGSFSNVARAPFEAVRVTVARPVSPLAGAIRVTVSVHPPRSVTLRRNGPEAGTVTVEMFEYGAPPPVA